MGCWHATHALVALTTGTKTAMMMRPGGELVTEREYRERRPGAFAHVGGVLRCHGWPVVNYRLVALGTCPECGRHGESKGRRNGKHRWWCRECGRYWSEALPEAISLGGGALPIAARAHEFLKCLE